MSRCAPAERGRARLTLGSSPTHLQVFVHGAWVVMACDPHQSIMNIIGGQYIERWPDEERRTIIYTVEFTYKQRLTACTFLYGNVRDAGLVYEAIREQLGVDTKDHDHARRFLADLASGKYDLKYHYFDVLAGDWLYLSGAVNAHRTPPSPLARALLAWDRECVRLRRCEGRWPTLGEQRAFGLG